MMFGNLAHLDNEIFIDDLKANVIVLAVSTFINLKLHSLNKIIKHVIAKAKETYIERSLLH